MSASGVIDTLIGLSRARSVWFGLFQNAVGMGHMKRVVPYSYMVVDKTECAVEYLCGKNWLHDVTYKTNNYSSKSYRICANLFLELFLRT